MQLLAVVYIVYIYMYYYYVKKERYKIVPTIKAAIDTPKAAQVENLAIGALSTLSSSVKI